ncbi:hypothetical protein ACIQUM_37400 [Amycolatopsis azurea]|uniref:hypothetical protein n=1 Tax=Amycolatopsis azurea TaxID=36819 RepID=UPI0037FFF0C0
MRKSKVFTTVISTFALVASMVGVASASPARLPRDCGDSFANSYLGSELDGNGRFSVRINYVDVARFIGSKSGTMTFMSLAGGARYSGFNASPAGGSPVVANVDYQQAGAWQVNVFDSRGVDTCARRFVVRYKVRGE